MKANEMPERVYLFDYNDAMVTPLEGDTVYVMEDAFIEKALDYIENNIYDHYDGDHEYGICGGYVKKEEFIENFKDHMKGDKV